ncbi:MAG: K(+)-transporting ATPase subunit F [Elusimicrobia bacterium]|nr:K(+)-transporting ATPase subunit F [Elusimicrobiota bacterium]
MTALYSAALAVACALCAYLVVALFKPELF